MGRGSLYSARIEDLIKPKYIAATPDQKACCIGKSMFFCKDSARRAVYEHAHNNNSRVYAYVCPYCTEHFKRTVWHIGHRRK